VKGYGIPLGRVLAPASRPDSPLLAPRWTSSITSAAARQRPGPPRCRLRLGEDLWETRRPRNDRPDRPQTRSSPSVVWSGRHGPPTAGTPGPRIDGDPSTLPREL